MRCAGATVSTTATAPSIGALLDSELLAEVYIELIGGKQAALLLESTVELQVRTTTAVIVDIALRERPAPLAPRITDAERAAHARMVATLGEKAIWAKIAAA